MQFTQLTILFALAASIAAQDVDNNDVPQQCRAVCASVVQWSQSCDTENTNDQQELNCICNSPNAASVVPACDACVRNFNNGDAGDVHDILTSCRFTTTSYNPAAASSAPASASPSPSAPASAPASPSNAASGGASASAGTSVSAAASASASRASNSAGAPSASGSAAQSSAPAQQSANAGPAHAAAAGVAGLGAFGVVLAML